MLTSYRFYLLDENSRVLGSLHGDFAGDDSALACASDMLKGSLGVEVWQEGRFVGRLTRKGETVDEVAAVKHSRGSAQPEESTPVL